LTKKIVLSKLNNNLGESMLLGDYLPPEHIIVELKGNTKLEIIEELLKCMLNLNLVNEFDLAFDDILAREGYLSTGLENGVAIPHAKTGGIDKLAMVFGLKKEGIDFESLDAKPAQLIFLVLSPLETSGPHIQALALITRNLKDEEVRNKIIEAKSADDISAIFQSFG
jgi:mannitol/fructose-specific phosphotransferase system IIA component (Ntr-type)